jgi:hypothetical protein
LKPIKATRQNEPELLPMKKTLTNKKAKLINCKLKKRLKPIKEEAGNGKNHNRQKNKPKHETTLSKNGFCIFAPAPNGLR